MRSYNLADEPYLKPVNVLAVFSKTHSTINKNENNVREERVWPKPIVRGSNNLETTMLRVISHRASPQGVGPREWGTGLLSQCRGDTAHNFLNEILVLVL
jgi:hypothetical protein